MIIHQNPEVCIAKSSFKVVVERTSNAIICNQKSIKPHFQKLIFYFEIFKLIFYKIIPSILSKHNTIIFAILQGHAGPQGPQGPPGEIVSLLDIRSFSYPFFQTPHFYSHFFHSLSLFSQIFLLFSSLLGTTRQRGSSGSAWNSWSAWSAWS